MPIMFMFIFIAILQGVTEFLPVSSSGHLVLASYFFDFHTPETLLFFLVVHAGTALSALYFFRKEVIDILLGMVDLVSNRKSVRCQDALKWVGLIAMVSFPTMIAGLFLKSQIDHVSSNVPIVAAFGLIITAVVLFFTKKAVSKNLELHRFSYGNAFLVGLAQSLALFPGISRSGSTIAVALFLGASPKFAGQLSFLASFVAIFGALLLETISFLQKDNISIPVHLFLIGFIVSFIVGLWALKFLIKILSYGKLYLFSIYCFIVGIVCLIVIK